jgi:hypothetical protein
MSEPVLKPCPLCQGDAALRDKHYEGTGSGGMETPWPFVICNKCGLRTVPVKCDDSPYGKRTKAKSYAAARSEAVAAWNTRQPEPVNAEPNALVERALWLASGQDDPHSATISELCATIQALEARVREAREVVQEARELLQYDPAQLDDWDASSGSVVKRITAFLAKGGDNGR